MNKQQLIAIAMGAACATAMSVQAAGNPLAAQTLDSGYSRARAKTRTREGKCGEAKCGSDKKSDRKTKDGKCGEAKCGSDKKK